MAREQAENPAIAAVEYALATDDGLVFLELWLHGQFDVIRREWPDCPQAVFVGAEVTPLREAQP